MSSAREFRGDNNQQSWLVNYDYDLFGNRYQKQSRNQNNPFSQIWTEDADINQATNRFASSVSYDDAGNITVDSKFRNLQFQYDANNRQKQSANLDGSGVVVSVYDAGGQRVATQVGGSLTNVLVYDAMSKLVAEYGSPAATGGTQYLFSDHQGSPRAVTNSSGAVISRHDYAPFGEELSAGVGMRTASQGYSNGDNARQKYAGMESDDATGMSHTLWRQYDSSSGRWTSPDPYTASMTIANPQSFNRYSYVGNDPVNMRDPSGLMTKEGQPDPDPADAKDEPPGDPFETGRDIIGAAEARHDRWVDIDRAGGNYGDDDYPATKPTGDMDTAKAALAEAAAAGGDSSGDTPTATVDLMGGDLGVPQTGSGATWSENATMVVTWGPGGLNRIGHVSYIFMQNDRSLSWEGEGYPLHNKFSEKSPSALYTDERSKTSEGRGYILDFGTKVNAKFQKALRRAYEILPGVNGPYDPLSNNCAHAFVRAMNAIRKEIRAPMIIVAGPATIETYIGKELRPRHYVKGTAVFPKY